MNRKITVLITSAGSCAAEAIVASLQEVRHEIWLVGTNSVAEFVCISDLDAAYLVPATSDRGGFEGRMREILDIENPDLILNGRDEEVQILSELTVETGHLFLGPPPSLVNVFSDKYQTYQFCLRNGLPFAETAANPEELETLIQNHGFPLIAKPRVGGHASKDVFLLFNRKQADRLLAANRFVFQQFLGDGRTIAEFRELGEDKGIPWIWNPVESAYMLDFVIGDHGKTVSLCITRGESRGSVLQRLELLDDSTLVELAHRYIAVLGRHGHRGPVNVQGHLNQDGQFCAFEWNARFVGSVDGFALLGKNLVMDALADRFPLSIAAPIAHDERRVIFRPMMYKAVSQKMIRQLALNGSCQAIDFAN